MERKEKNIGYRLTSTPFLPILLKLRISKDLKTNKVRLGDLSCIRNLLDRVLHGGELDQRKECRREIRIVLIEHI